MNKSSDDECEQRRYDNRNRWHGGVGRQQIAIPTGRKRAIERVMKRTIHGCCGGAQGGDRLVRPLGHNKLADQWREHDKPHGDQAKPGGCTNAGA